MRTDPVNQCWEDFEKATPDDVEGLAQKVTHLYLRVAGYGNLVIVFDCLSRHSPPRYNSWRDTWKKHSKNKDSSFGTAIRAFQHELREERWKREVRERSDIHRCGGYDS
jgi:hypothetical protein